MRKMTAFVLVILLLFALAIPASAANQTTVTTTVDDEYIVTIPETCDIVFEAQETDLSIDVDIIRIAPNKVVAISLPDSAGTLKHELNETNTIPYTVKEGVELFDEATYTADGTLDLTIVIETAAWDAAVAGGYSDTLTFTVACVETSTP